MMSSIVFYFVILALPFIVCDDENVCKTVSPCSCMFPNGTGIDLSPGKPVRAFDYTTSSENSHKTIKMKSIYYFPCKDGIVNVTDNPSSNTCNGALAICRDTYTLKINSSQNNKSEVISQEHTYESLGSNEKVIFVNHGRSIRYNNSPSDNIIQLECTPNAIKDSLTYDDREPNNVVMTLYSQRACFKQLMEISTRSTGSTLLIILFTMILIYLVLGVCTKKYLMGAQGIEVVPNIDFWRDLPALCREGWWFLRNGCTVPRADSGAPGPASPNPSSYNSI